MEELLALAARCEAAGGADRELDRDIHALVDGWEKRWNDKLEFFQLWKGSTWIGLGSVPRYTESLDAAMKLLPETDAATAVFWKLGNDGEGGDPALFKATILVAHMLASKSFTAVADTPALALTAAALKARAGEGSV